MPTLESKGYPLEYGEVRFKELRQLCCINGVARCFAMSKYIETSPKAPTMGSLSLPMGVTLVGGNVDVKVNGMGAKPRDARE
ncbi:hypothetical protein L7F22_005362, partial [Adiantum nelumboides]|nr:hypothetical protein [Adiantum nelumboides]